jgi:hypothetical protein
MPEEVVFCHRGTSSFLLPTNKQIVSGNQTMNFQQIVMNAPCIKDKCMLWDKDNGTCIELVVHKLTCKRTLKEMKFMARMIKQEDSVEQEESVE